MLLALGTLEVAANRLQEATHKFPGGHIVTIAYALERVMVEYPDATTEPFPAHPVGRLLRQSLPDELGIALGPAAAGMKIHGSAGQGIWAAVPWVAVFDRAITETAM